MLILERLEAWVSGFGSVIEKWLEAILSEYFFYANDILTIFLAYLF